MNNALLIGSIYPKQLAMLDKFFKGEQDFDLFISTDYEQRADVKAVLQSFKNLKVERLLSHDWLLDYIVQRDSVFRQYELGFKIGAVKWLQLSGYDRWMIHDDDVILKQSLFTEPWTNHDLAVSKIHFDRYNYFDFYERTANTEDIENFNRIWGLDLKSEWKWAELSSNGDILCGCGDTRYWNIWEDALEQFVSDPYFLSQIEQRGFRGDGNRVRCYDQRFFTFWLHRLRAEGFDVASYTGTKETHVSYYLERYDKRPEQFHRAFHNDAYYFVHYACGARKELVLDYLEEQTPST